AERRASGIYCGGTGGPAPAGEAEQAEHHEQSRAGLGDGHPEPEPEVIAFAVRVGPLPQRGRRGRRTTPFATPIDAPRRYDYGFSPLHNVSILIERAVRARRAGVAADRRYPADGLHAIRSIGRCARQCTCRRCIGARRVIEVGPRLRIIVRGLVPLVLARNDESST